MSTCWKRKLFQRDGPEASGTAGKMVSRCPAEDWGTRIKREGREKKILKMGGFGSVVLLGGLAFNGRVCIWPGIKLYPEGRKHCLSLKEGVEELYMSSIRGRKVFRE